ncbi:DUF1700 domain-containing protein [Caballeronia sp.]|uniref:DUF1700 domain-containing protein n=1 Tax=Caballeronia sp. TaxID=1931223 RepID=UPI003C57785F
MTQEAFIQQLRHELRSLSKDVVDEIIADYREYIGDALAAGRNEAEVIAALGDPVKLGRELKAQATFRQWETRRSFGNLMRVFVSIAGLGLLQLLLLVPFMLYLLLLTAGYAVSLALTLAGLVTVIALGSHHLFGWPAFDALPFSFESTSHQLAEDPKALSDDDDPDDEAASGTSANVSANASASATMQASGAAPGETDPHLADEQMRDFRVVGDLFELRAQSGTHISVVTTAGPLDIKNVDGKVRINAVGGARDQFTVNGDTWSIPRANVLALDIKDDKGNKLSVARIGADPNAMAWDIRNDGDHVSFVQGGRGGGHLSVESGPDSVTLEHNRVAIQNGSDKVVIVGPHGSGIGAMIYGFAMLVAGVVGLWLCIWLTRTTWRGLVRYVRRQIERITQRLDEGQSG